MQPPALLRRFQRLLHRNRCAEVPRAFPKFLRLEEPVFRFSDAKIVLQSIFMIVIILLLTVVIVIAATIILILCTYTTNYRYC